MNKQIAISRFIVEPPRYERVLASKCLYLHSTRQHEQLLVTASLLPTSLSTFYELLAKEGLQTEKISNHFDTLENILWHMSDIYKPRIMMTLGIYLAKVDKNTGASYCREAYRLALRHKDLHCLLATRQHEALLASFSGDHEGSVSSLREGLTLARFNYRYYPVQVLNYLNSLAVELGACGELAEARYYIGFVVKSPYASVYPEWTDTYRTISNLDRKTKSCFIRGAEFPKHLRLVRRDMTDQPKQKDPQELSDELLLQTEDAYWRIAPKLSNPEKLRILNFILSYESRLSTLAKA